MVEVVITSEAIDQLLDLPASIAARVWKIADRLEQWPNVSGAKPLSGKLAGRYRIRTGDYRVQFYVRGAKVVIERIGHRDGFYEGR